MEFRVRWEIDIELPDPEDYPGTAKDMLTDACQQAQLIMSEQLISSSPDVHKPYFEVIVGKKRFTVDFDRGNDGKPTVKRQLRTKVVSHTINGGRNCKAMVYDLDSKDLLWAGTPWPADGSAEQEAYERAKGLREEWKDKLEDGP